MTFMVQPTPSIMRPEQALFPVTTSAQQPPTNTWCKRVFACHHCPWSIGHWLPLTRSHVSFAMCVCAERANRKRTCMSHPPFCSPRLFPHGFLFFPPHFIDSISEGELFFIPWWLTATENPGSDSHWASEWAGTQSGNICDYESRFI